VMEKNKDELWEGGHKTAKASFGKTMGDMFGRVSAVVSRPMPNPRESNLELFEVARHSVGGSS